MGSRTSLAIKAFLTRSWAALKSVRYERMYREIAEKKGISLGKLYGIVLQHGLAPFQDGEGELSKKLREELDYSDIAYPEEFYDV